MHGNSASPVTRYAHLLVHDLPLGPVWQSLVVRQLLVVIYVDALGHVGGQSYGVIRADAQALHGPSGVYAVEGFGVLR